MRHPTMRGTKDDIIEIAIHRAREYACHTGKTFTRQDAEDIRRKMEPVILRTLLDIFARRDTPKTPAT